MSTLRRGSRGEEVIRLQLLLNAALTPAPGLQPDGDFGRMTHDALVRFQQAHGLTPDGVAGPRTWQALELRPGAPPPLPLASPDAPWLSIARAEFGVRELSGAGRHSQRIVAYHQTTGLRATDDETPWCSSFVNWVMVQAGYRGTNSAAARSWLNWGRELGDEPRQGAITVLKRRGRTSDAATGSTSGFHVAFFLSRTTGAVTLLGGNQGNRVKESTYPLSNYEVRGYRWPV
jgi:uncharacterized protein (TIGR02594 family)